MTTYDIDYFIAKFEAIPEDRWQTIGLVDSAAGILDVFGHCGVRDMRVRPRAPLGAGRQNRVGARCNAEMQRQPDNVHVTPL